MNIPPSDYTYFVDMASLIFHYLCLVVTYIHAYIYINPNELIFAEFLKNMF